MVFLERVHMFYLQKHQQTPEPRHAAQSKVSTPHAEETVQRIVKDEVLSKKRSEATYQARERQADGRHHMGTRRDNLYERKDELKHNVAKASELSNNRYKPPLFKEEETIRKREDHDNYLRKREQKADRLFNEDDSAKGAIQVGKTSHRERLESFDSQYEVGRHRQENVSERDLFKTLSPQKHDQWPVGNGMSSPSNVNNEPTENIHVRSTRTMEDVTDGLKSNFRGGIPPPYVKPRKSKHKVDAEENDTLTFYPAGNSNRAETLLTKKSDFPEAHENSDGMGRFTEIYYKDESGIESTPRRKTQRRKHTRTSSSQDVHVNGDSVKEERVVRRVSTSRRKNESRKGLQVLFDDDHYKKDEEERMIDKLLLHYSKKPDPGKPRRECKNRSNDPLKSAVYKDTVVNDKNKEDSTPRKETSRSMSFPPRQLTQPESQKLFARAASLQQETPAKHVHPKLPDYDDLAARFAGLRATKG